MEKYRPAILVAAVVLWAVAMASALYDLGRKSAREDFFEHTGVVVGYPKVYNQVFFGKCADFTVGDTQGQACAVKFNYP